jgi:hypothetical protein
VTAKYPDGVVLHTVSTGHRLQVRRLSALSTPGVVVTSDLIAGDGARDVFYTADEMDALVAWWQSQKEVTP